MRWFVRENDGEAATRKALLHKTVCVRHAHTMFLAEDARLSRTFEFHAKSRLLETEVQRRPVADAPQCPICEAGEVAAKAAMQDFLRTLETARGRVAYQEHGLCLAHHDRAVLFAENETATWLAEDLLAQFALYHRHWDVRFQHEPKGDEQEAWRRGLRLFWADVAARFDQDGEAAPV